MDAATGATPRNAKLVCFSLEGQEFGAAIGDIKETLAVRPITRVALTPAWLAGIMNLRGDVVAVIDLARFLGLPATRVTDDTRVVLAQRAGLRAGLLVSALAELRLVDLERLEPPPATLGEAASFLAGVVTLAHGGVLRVLDLGRLLESDRIRTLDGTREPDA